jgi:hypothetical protein
MHCWQRRAADRKMFCIVANGTATHAVLISLLMSCSARGFEVQTAFFTAPHRKNGVRSGVLPLRPIHLPGKRTWRKFLTSIYSCDGAPSCWKCNLSSRNKLLMEGYPRALKVHLLRSNVNFTNTNLFYINYWHLMESINTDSAYYHQGAFYSK